MATDTGIVTIYDLKNDMKPLVCHRIDAREFLAHKSGRWSSSPDKKSIGIAPDAGKDTGEDTGEAMRLKAMDNKALKGLAEKKMIPDYQGMNKTELVAALLAETEPPEDKKD